MDTQEQTQMKRPEFPKTLNDFTRRFRDVTACRAYLEESRWPHGFTCPTCGSRKASLIESRNLHRCENGHQVSATAGTVMHKSKIDLPTWFWGAYMVTTHTPGISATQFARQLDLGYETAYMMLQRLRAGMVSPQRGKLRGRVQVDECWIGGRHRDGKVGRAASGKTIVVVAVEQRKGGRLRLMVVPNVGREALFQFILDNVEKGSTIVTDSAHVYFPLHGFGYQHESTQTDHVAGEHDPLQLTHRIIANLKTWLLGTHHGRVTSKHLQAYLNEFVFRFNRREVPMAAFQTVLGIGANVKGPTYEGIYEGTWQHPRPLASCEPTR